MAHKTLVDGTAYEIGGGNTLINGTGYSIEKGKTLVGGTAYDVGFLPPMVTVTIGHLSSGANYPEKAYIVIDGQTYHGDTEHIISVPIGTVVTCYSSSNLFVLNGVMSNGDADKKYYHEVTTNTEFLIASDRYVSQVNVKES